MVSTSARWPLGLEQTGVCGLRTMELLTPDEQGQVVTLERGRLEQVPIVDFAGQLRLTPSEHARLRAARGIGANLGNRPAHRPGFEPRASGRSSCYLPTMIRVKNRARRGLTMTELLTAIALVAILLSIFIPYIVSVRDYSSRVNCADRLRQFQVGLSAYSLANDGWLPQVRLDEVSPDRYDAYTGATVADPFAADSPVKTNDVTASLWLLVRAGYITQDAAICPGTSDRSLKIESPTTWGNFSRGALSYSYATPFSSLADYSLNSDRLRGEFVVMADLNPGFVPDELNTNSQPGVLALANSHNHRRGGQNVLYGAGNVEFHSTPFCGFGGDNIYTALRMKPLTAGERPPANGRGYISRDIGPTWYADSYLVPTAAD